MKYGTLIFLLLTSYCFLTAQPSQRKSLREVNQVAQPPSTSTIAIVGATLIDGRGGPGVPDSVVIIRGDRIAKVGQRTLTTVPPGAEVIDGKGLTLAAHRSASHDLHQALLSFMRLT